MDSILRRLLAKVKLDPTTGCWLWQGAMSQSGWRGVFYPVARAYGTLWRLNRLMLILREGPDLLPRAPDQPWPEWLAAAARLVAGREAAHTCDTAQCVNPAHLEWKGHRANVQEQKARQREAREAQEAVA